MRGVGSLTVTEPSRVRQIYAIDGPALQTTRAVCVSGSSKVSLREEDQTMQWARILRISVEGDVVQFMVQCARHGRLESQRTSSLLVLAVLPNYPFGVRTSLFSQ